MLAVICCGIPAGCNGKEAEKKEDVTLIVKVPSLIMNSVSNQDILEAATFLQQAGEAFAAQYEEASWAMSMVNRKTYMMPFSSM